MTHSIEPASSGRARCRGCGQKIAKDELRLGERLPNPFAEEGDMTLWFHLRCGALKRPEAMLEALEAAADEVEDATELSALASQGVEHRRLPRLDGVERAPTGRARCRWCRETIEKGAWRIVLVFFEDGRFNPSGFVHPGCCREYFGTADLIDRLTHFTADLTAAEIDEIRTALTT